MTDNRSHAAWKYPCPCCGQNTLDEVSPGSYEICSVCGWEDDLAQYKNPDLAGGANKTSLNKARKDYAYRK